MNVYENHRMEDPRLPFIFHFTRYPANRPRGQGNWHENVELLYFVSGSATVTSNEEQLCLRAGEIAVLNTNCLHTVSTAEGVEYYCLIVDRNFCLANHFDTGRIRFTPIVRDGEIAALFSRLVGEYKEDGPYRVPLIRATVLGIMVLLCKNYGSLEETEGRSVRIPAVLPV